MRLILFYCHLIAVASHQNHFEDSSWLWVVKDLSPVFKATYQRQQNHKFIAHSCNNFGHATVSNHCFTSVTVAIKYSKTNQLFFYCILFICLVEYFDCTEFFCLVFSSYFFYHLSLLFPNFWHIFSYLDEYTNIHTCFFYSNLKQFLQQLS